MEKTLVRVQLDKSILDKAREVFKENNLTDSEAITLLYQNILLRPELPFPLEVKSNE